MEFRKNSQEIFGIFPKKDKWHFLYFNKFRRKMVVFEQSRVDDYDIIFSNTIRTDRDGSKKVKGEH